MSHVVLECSPSGSGPVQSPDLWMVRVPVTSGYELLDSGSQPQRQFLGPQISSSSLLIFHLPGWDRHESFPGWSVPHGSGHCSWRTSLQHSLPVLPPISEAPEPEPDSLYYTFCVKSLGWSQLLAVGFLLKCACYTTSEFTSQLQAMVLVTTLTASPSLLVGQVVKLWVFSTMESLKKYLAEPKLVD